MLIAIIIHLFISLLLTLAVIRETVNETDWAANRQVYTIILITVILPIFNLIMLLVILTDKEKG